ncbi:hypothetical protein HZS_2077 [Henneguya salminicola]|nr:hypothetical protein HZS_2077 [Henneguya salminicola]
MHRKALKCPQITSSQYEFALNSLFYTGSDLDAYYIRFSYQTIYLDDNATVPIMQNKIMREILCTRSFQVLLFPLHLQIQKITESFQKSFNIFKNIVYGKRLSDFILKKARGSEKYFFLSLLKDERSTSLTLTEDKSLLLDFNLFLSKKYYRRNKEKFIKLFVTASYCQIRKICEIFQETYNISLIKLFQSHPLSSIKRCAKTICQFSVNSYEYFARQMRKYIYYNPLGVIRIIASRAEIDLMNILRAYNNSHENKMFLSIESCFYGNKIYSNILCPLMGRT